MLRLGRIRLALPWQSADPGIAMEQMGFFDVANRYAGLDAKATPLVTLTAIVPRGRPPPPARGDLATVGG